MDTSQLLPVFLTGLLAGGLSCMAVQGGLLATVIAQKQQERLQTSGGNMLPIMSFLVAKLIIYTLLGFFLGWLGSLLQISLQVQVVLLILVSLFMLATALNMLHVHPIFRYVVIQPPHFLTKLLRKEMRSKSIFAPVMLGLFTVFIPCGTTQAVMALAIASRSPLTGAALLYAFVLGTSPLFFLLGYFTAKLGEKLRFTFTRFAALIIILFAVFSLNNAVALSGSSFTFEGLSLKAWCFISFCDDLAQPLALSVDPAITIDNSGYTPNELTIKSGMPVSIRLTNAGGSGCTQDFTIPQLGIQKIVPIGKSDVISFTAPSRPGQLSFMCSMGMYRGTIHVI